MVHCQNARMHQLGLCRDLFAVWWYSIFSLMTSIKSVYWICRWQEAEQECTGKIGMELKIISSYLQHELINSRIKYCMGVCKVSHFGRNNRLHWCRMNNEAEKEVTVEKATGDQKLKGNHHCLARKKKTNTAYVYEGAICKAQKLICFSKNWWESARVLCTPWDNEPWGKCGPAGERPEEGTDNNQKLRKHDF